MGEELQQVSGSGESIQAGAPSPSTSGEGVTPGAAPELSGDIKAMIEAEVARVRQEYESAGGKIAQIQSKKDKEVAELKRQLRQQREAEYKEAMGYLEGGDYESAAQILAQQVQQLTGSAMQEGQRAEMAGWIQTIMADLGADVEGDEEAATFATEWLDRVVGDPNLAWDFQQAAAKRQIAAQQKAAEAAAQELKKVQDALPALIKAQVTRVLADAGIAPEPSGEGGGSTQDEWRNLPAGQLINRGLAQRRPIQRK